MVEAELRAALLFTFTVVLEELDSVEASEGVSDAAAASETLDEAVEPRTIVVEEASLEEVAVEFVLLEAGLGSAAVG